MYSAVWKVFRYIQNLFLTMVQTCGKFVLIELFVTNPLLETHSNVYYAELAWCYFVYHTCPTLRRIDNKHEGNTTRMGCWYC